MDSGDVLAIVALLISLVALFVSLGQLFQQYLGTADGYRRCLPSVMGVWGTKTQLHWRKREFRFETIYYVPKLTIETLQPKHVHLNSAFNLLPYESVRWYNTDPVTWTAEFSRGRPSKSLDASSNEKISWGQKIWSRLKKVFHSRLSSWGRKIWSQLRRLFPKGESSEDSEEGTRRWLNRLYLNLRFYWDNKIRNQLDRMFPKRKVPWEVQCLGKCFAISGYFHHDYWWQPSPPDDLDK
jgi:hypothetical protein